MELIFYKFWENLFKIFRGKNLLWHLLAIVLTYLIVVSGFDWKYFVFFNGSTLQYVLFSASALGGLLPILLPVTFYLLGSLKKMQYLKIPPLPSLKLDFSAGLFLLLQSIYRQNPTASAFLQFG